MMTSVVTTVHNENNSLPFATRMKIIVLVNNENDNNDNDNDNGQQ